MLAVPLVRVTSFERSAPDHEARPLRQQRSEAQHVCRRNRNAAGGRWITGIGDMQENCAAAATHSARQIEVQDHDDIVKSVAPGHRLATRREGQTDRPVVGSMFWRIAPGIDVRSCTPNRQSHGRPRHAARAMIGRNQRHVGNGGGTVPLALEDRRRAFPECAAQTQVSCLQDAERRPSRGSPDEDRRRALHVGRAGFSIIAARKTIRFPAQSKASP